VVSNVTVITENQGCHIDATFVNSVFIGLHLKLSVVYLFIACSSYFDESCKLEATSEL